MCFGGQFVAIIYEAEGFVFQKVHAFTRMWQQIHLIQYMQKYLLLVQDHFIGYNGFQKEMEIVFYYSPKLQDTANLPQSPIIH